MKERTDWVDYAKAIGIILVVYGHVARGVYNAGIAIPENMYVLADSIIYSFHMPLFFFLSGLFFYHSFSKRGSKKLIFSKVDTIVYPYILWSLLQGSIEVALSNYTNGSVSFIEVISLFSVPRAQFWFLYALFLIFVFCTLVYSVKKDLHSAWLFTVGIIAYLFNAHLPDFRPLIFIYNYLVFFGFGVLFTQVMSIKFFDNYLILAFAGMSFITAQWYFHDVLSLNYSNRGALSLGLAVVSILFVVTLSIALSRLNLKWFAYIGGCSMAIYLMHILAGSGVRVILTKGFNITSYEPHLVIGTVFGLLGPIIAFIVIKRIKIPFVFEAPLSRWIFRVN